MKQCLRMWQLGVNITMGWVGPGLCFCFPCLSPHSEISYSTGDDDPVISITFCLLSHSGDMTVSISALCKVMNDNFPSPPLSSHQKSTSTWRTYSLSVHPSMVCVLLRLVSWCCQVGVLMEHSTDLIFFCSECSPWRMVSAWQPWSLKAIIHRAGSV